jgi:hypothetical protein
MIYLWCLASGIVGATLLYAFQRWLGVKHTEESAARLAERAAKWCHDYHANHGRYPTLDELRLYVEHSDPTGGQSLDMIPSVRQWIEQENIPQFVKDGLARGYDVYLDFDGKAYRYAPGTNGLLIERVPTSDAKFTVPKLRVPDEFLDKLGVKPSEAQRRIFESLSHLRNPGHHAPGIVYGHHTAESEIAGIDYWPGKEHGVPDPQDTLEEYEHDGALPGDGPALPHTMRTEYDPVPEMDGIRIVADERVESIVATPYSAEPFTAAELTEALVEGWHTGEGLGVALHEHMKLSHDEYVRWVIEVDSPLPEDFLARHHCHGGRDGDCTWGSCPQEFNGRANYRSYCPLAKLDEQADPDYHGA